MVKIKWLKFSIKPHFENNKTVYQVTRISIVFTLTTRMKLDKIIFLQSRFFFDSPEKQKQIKINIFEIQNVYPSVIFTNVKTPLQF